MGKAFETELIIQAERRRLATELGYEGLDWCYFVSLGFRPPRPSHATFLSRFVGGLAVWLRRLSESLRAAGARPKEAKE